MGDVKKVTVYDSYGEVPSEWVQQATDLTAAIAEVLPHMTFSVSVTAVDCSIDAAYVGLDKVRRLMGQSLSKHMYAADQWYVIKDLLIERFEQAWRSR